MEDEIAYTVIWADKRRQLNPEAHFGFAIKPDLDEGDSTFAEIDLTAEEIGQLMGGS